MGVKTNIQTNETYNIYSDVSVCRHYLCGTDTGFRR